MVLVTGASGFLGQHFVRFLSQKGETVRALYNSTPPNEALFQFPNVHWMQCDLLDVYAVEEAMKGIDEIYHCAAVVSFHPRKKQQMLQTNIDGTANIVNEALEQNVHKLLYVSSAAALGRNGQTSEINEEEQWEESHENSTYGLSKYMAEKEVWRGIGEGLQAVIVNPTLILGEGNYNEGSPRLIKLVYEQFPFYTKGVNGWVDVTDVVGASYMLMKSDISAERFILNEDNYAYYDVFSRLAKAMHRKPPYIRARAWMSGIIWRWNMVKSLFSGATVTITKETAKNAQSIYRYHNGKLKKALPAFQYHRLDDTLQRLARAYLQSLS